MDVTSNTNVAGNMLSGVIGTKNDGTSVTGNIATKTSSDLTASGATVTAPAGYYANAASKAVSTTTHPNPTAAITSSTGVVTASHTQGTGYVTGGTTTGTLSLTTQAGKTVTPTESAQTAVASYRWTTGPISVAAISSTYVGTGVAKKSSADLTASGSTVTAPAGYYSTAATKNIGAGSAFPPAVTITKAPTIGVNTSGVVTASYNGSSSITPTVTSGYVSQGTAGTISTTGTSTYQLTSKAAATYYPSTADQTIASQRWLVGNQTIKSVTTTNLTAANIAEGVVVKVGDSANASRITQVTGTHSSGVDIPTFTVTWNNNYTEILSVTCDKTYSEVAALMDNNDNSCVMAKDGTEGFYYSLDFWGQYDTSFCYFSVNWGYDITYNSNGTIEFNYPSRFWDDLNVTSNGTYYPQQDSLFYVVNVNVPAGFTADQIAMRSIGGNISGDATTIGSYAFYNCRSITGASFSLATTIGGYAFYGCSSLSTVNFPSVQYIWSSAFYDCTTLSAANFSSVTTIASNAFRYCYALTTASFPSVSSIANYAFYACSKLSSLYLLGSSVASLGGTSVFTQTRFSLSSAGVYGSIFVPSSLYNSYLTATYWSAYSARIVSV